MIYELRLTERQHSIVVAALTYANRDAIADEHGAEYEETDVALKLARDQLAKQSD